MLIIVLHNTPILSHIGSQKENWALKILLFLLFNAEIAIFIGLNDNHTDNQTRIIMILTTTPSVEGRNIVEYKGIVFGEVVAGVNFFKDFGAGIRNIIGGRSSSYEGELIEARENALRELSARASSLGADAVVGIDLDYEVLGEGGGMLMVTASGTAVKLG